MTTKSLGRRIECVRRAGDAGAASRFVVVFPESWPADVLAAYEAAAAAGDHTRVAEIVWSQTGVRPTFRRTGVEGGGERRTPPIVEIRTRPDGPQ